MGHNTAEATKDYYCMKGKDAVDHCIVTRWFKKFYLGCKNHDEKEKSGTV